MLNCRGNGRERSDERVTDWAEEVEVTPSSGVVMHLADSQAAYLEDRYFYPSHYRYGLARPGSWARMMPPAIS